MTVDLHFNRFGDGSAVMILHGLFGSSRNWQSMAKKLAGQYCVYTVDLRNHGLSGSAESMSYPEMANDVVQLIRRLYLDQIVLVGHSMGGKVAMQTALSHPEIVCRIAILDIAPVAYAHRYGKLFTVMKQLPVDEIKSRQEAETWLNAQVDDLLLTRFLLQNLVREEVGFAWRINIETIQNNIEIISGFPKIDKMLTYPNPALFLGGANSHLLQEKYHPLIRKHFPSAEIHLLENAGHMLHVEQPDLVEDLLRAFLCH